MMCLQGQLRNIYSEGFKLIFRDGQNPAKAFAHPASKSLRYSSEKINN